MNTPKVAVLILILMGFGFIITAQRLESRNIEIQIADLQKNIETINSQKREMHLAIESEMQRLSMQNSYESSLPISLNDIIKVEVAQSRTQDDAGETASGSDTFAKLIAWLSSARN